MRELRENINVKVLQEFKIMLYEKKSCNVDTTSKR